MASLDEVKRSGSVSFRVTIRAHLFIQSFNGGKQRIHTLQALVLVAYPAPWVELRARSALVPRRVPVVHVVTLRAL